MIILLAPVLALFLLIALTIGVLCLAAAMTIGIALGGWVCFAVIGLMVAEDETEHNNNSSSKEKTQ